MGASLNYFEKEARARKAAGHSNADIAEDLCCDITRVEQVLLGEYVVRITQDIVQDMPAFLNCLSDFFQIHRVSDDTIYFDILPPSEQDSEKWAKRTVDTLMAAGFDATIASRRIDD